jgi:hypothetical protein
VLWSRLFSQSFCRKKKKSCLHYCIFPPCVSPKSGLSIKMGPSWLILSLGRLGLALWS